MKNLNKFVFIGGGILAVFFVVKMVAAETAPAQLDLPDHLLLKTTKDRLLGSAEDAKGDVKYAFRSDVQIDSNPSAAVAKKAETDGLQITKEALDQRTKHSRTFETSKEGVYVAEIISGEPQYYKDDNGGWWQAEYATTTKEAFNMQVAQRTLGEKIAAFLFPHTQADSTFFPDSSSVDGLVGRAVTSESWANIIAGAGTEADDFDTLENAWLINSYTTQDNWNVVRRSIYLFNTASIGQGAIISSATFSLYGQAKSPDRYGQSAVMTDSNPASNTSLAASDYSNVGGVEQASNRISISSWTTTGYNDFTLNATGISNINTTGISKFGIKASSDFDATAPSWQSNTGDLMSTYYSETSGTAKDPKLVVVYSFKPTGYKPTDESRTNNTSLTADTDLALTLATSTIYSIEGAIFAAASSTVPDLKIAFTVPAGATMDIGYVAARGANLVNAELLNTSGAVSARIGLAPTPIVIHIKGTIKTGDTVGATVFKWAQFASSTNATSILRGSYLKAEAL